MKLKDAFKTAWRGVTHSKVRSLLTMLGIVIGIASVILLSSIGSSAQMLILDQVQGIGSNLIFVVPGATKGSKFSSPASVQGVIIKTLVKDDLNAFERDPAIKRAAPEVRGQAKIVFENVDTDVTFEGTTESFFQIRNYTIDKGSFFTRSDVDSFNQVAVIGPKLAETLFGGREPVGKTVRLKNSTFRIVGVFEKKGIGPFGVDQDNLIIIPVTIAQKQLLGMDYYSVINVEANDNYTIDFAKSRVISILRQTHRITDPDKDDFTVNTQEDALSLLGNITSIMTVFLSAIASISLVVGGIGIMNIMLVSVVERTREIGLRKALGATNRDIMKQFLIESVMITFIGGIIGILIGAFFVVVAYLILSRVLESGWFFSLPVSSIFIAVVVSSLVGIVFGIYPARKAAQKNPIDALRYE